MQGASGAGGKQGEKEMRMTPDFCTGLCSERLGDVAHKEKKAEGLRGRLERQRALMSLTACVLVVIET